jgi:transcriptional regulator with XRE-family HTH domain
MKIDAMSDTAILAELGQRLRRLRLNRNITQSDLAKQTGISRRTLQKAEDGNDMTMVTLVGILRGLDNLSQLDQFLPEPPVSPVQLAKLKGQTRKRATGKRKRIKRKSNWNWEK